MVLSPPDQCHESWPGGATVAPQRSHNSCTVHFFRSLDRTVGRSDREQTQNRTRTGLAVRFCVCSPSPGRPSDRRPYSVVEESPTIGSGVPHQVGPGRPRRWRRLRRRPRRRRPQWAPADQAARPTLVRASRTLPVVAVIRVQVVAPARIPWITRAPVVVGRRSRRRISDSASQSESGQRQTTSQHACAQPNPILHHPIISSEGRIHRGLVRLRA